jgi:hypothetical protein
VMQTNAHHPSDIRQVADGLRLVLRHAVRLPARTRRKAS